MSVMPEAAVRMPLNQVLALRSAEGVDFCRLHDRYQVICSIAFGLDDPTYGAQATVQDLLAAKRTHEHYESVLEAMRTEGQRQAVTVCTYGVLHDGHHRVAALAELGHDVLVSYEHLICRCRLSLTRRYR